jgi:hypothetical protein
MNVLNVIYAACELKPQDFTFTVFATDHLKKDFKALISNSENKQKPYFYQEITLMRLLSFKSDLLTQPLQEKLYGHSYDDTHFAFIISWRPSSYAYMRIELALDINETKKETLIEKLPDVARLIKQNLLQENPDD